MSVFLERQKVRKRKALAKRIRVAERILFSLAVIFGGVAALYGLYLLVFLGPIFSVKEVIIDGDLKHITKQEVVEVAKLGIGQNLFGANVSNGHDRLMSHPWVKHAAVRRRLPQTIWIYVEEHEPVAVVLNEGEAFYVNDQGVVFKVVDSEDPKDYQVISGVKGSEEKLKEALDLLSLYEKSSFGQNWGIAEINFDKDFGFSIMTEKGPIEILLGHDAFSSQLDFLGRCRRVMSRRGGLARHTGVPGGYIKYILANERKRITVGYRELTNNKKTNL